MGPEATVDFQLAGVEQRRLGASLYLDPRFPDPPAPGTPAFREYAKGTMRKHIEWAMRQTGGEGGAFASALHRQSFTKTLKKLRWLEATGQVDEVIESVLKNHPDREFTKQLLRTRLEVMPEVLAEYFPDIP